MISLYMGTIHTSPIRFSIAVELRFVGIQTHWIAREQGGKRYLVPLVNQRLGRKNAGIADPDEIRNRFFKMKNDEQSALDFLNGVGVWSAEEDPYITPWSDGTLRKGGVEVGVKDSLLVGAFGHRYFRGRATEIRLEGLCHERDRWRSLMRGNTAKLRKLFWPLSGDSVEEKYIFAANTQFGNTLPVHLEWQPKSDCPRAVIQPMTGEELLIALAWIDLVTEAEFKVCAKCGTEYTRGGRKFCTLQCEHANTMHTYRLKLKRKAEKHLRLPRVPGRA